MNISYPKRLGMTGLWLAAVCLLFGCQKPQQYKEEADQKVYQIIDQKWQEDFGSKANYIISDVPPSPNDLVVEKVIDPSGVLTLPQAVALATAHNRTYQLERENLYLKALDLTSVQHLYAPNVFGQALSQYLKNEGDASLDTSAAFGFDQLLASGATVSAQVASGWVHILSGDLDSGMNTLFAATITQPLLRGSGSDIALENLTQAQRDVLYQIRSFNRFRKNFVVDIVSRYYRILEQQEIMTNAEENHNVLTREYDKIKKLASMGRVPEFERDQAQQDVLQAQDRYLREQAEYQQLFDEFKLELTLPGTTAFQLDRTELERLYSLEIADLDFDENIAIATALSQRLDLANKANQVEDAERKVKVAADQLRAELNLIGTVEGVSETKTDISRIGPVDNTYGLGAQVDLPLDRLEERNNYRRALIALQLSKREHELEIETIILEVRDAYRDFREATQRYQVQLENIQLAQKRFDNTSKLVEYGRADTRDVLDAQEDLFEAKNDAAATLMDYTIATLQFYRDTEIMQVQPDGMWTYEAGK